MERSFIRIHTKKPGLVPHYANPQLAVPISRDDNFIMKKMSSSRNQKVGGKIVYSTNTTGNVPSGIVQKIIVWVEKKHHGGKTVTLVDGFIWHLEKIEEMSRTLKNKCGVGGTVKDRTILLQGDVKDRVIEILTKEGFELK